MLLPIRICQVERDLCACCAWSQRGWIAQSTNLRAGSVFFVFFNANTVC